MSAGCRAEIVKRGIFAQLTGTEFYAERLLDCLDQPLDIAIHCAAS
jgi:hypothetical protein